VDDACGDVVGGQENKHVVTVVRMELEKGNLQELEFMKAATLICFKKEAPLLSYLTIFLSS
jgi:hypothetical protein